MSSPIDSTGEIEIINYPARLHKYSVGDRVQLIFRPIDEPNPPYQLKISSPSGSSIVDTIIRALPTGEPQSPPPFEFVPSAGGMYNVEIREMRGRAKGIGKLKIG